MNGKDKQTIENAPPAEKTRRRDPANPFIGAVLAHAWDDRALALEIDSLFYLLPIKSVWLGVYIIPGIWFFRNCGAHGFTPPLQVSEHIPPSPSRPDRMLARNDDNRGHRNDRSPAQLPLDLRSAFAQRRGCVRRPKGTVLGGIGRLCVSVGLGEKVG